MSFSILLKRSLFFFALFSLLISCGASVAKAPQQSSQQTSIAYDWMETILAGFRVSPGRPNVHARTLYYTSMAMYDVWAAFDGSENSSNSFLLGKERSGYVCGFNGFTLAPGDDLAAERDKAISAAVYRTLIKLGLSSAAEEKAENFAQQLQSQGLLDFDFFENTDTDYSNHSATSLGNYLADCIANYALNDHSNQENDHASIYYEPVYNYFSTLYVGDREFPGPVSGNPGITPEYGYYNRWQPLRFDSFVGQGGGGSEELTPRFVGPEWGNVIPFALTVDDQVINSRDDHEYKVYHDQGPPPYLREPWSPLPQPPYNPADMDMYRWAFSLVAQWSADVGSEKIVDISPRTTGNINISAVPIWSNNNALFKAFYTQTADGARPYLGSGHTLNPSTNQAYTSNEVELGDFTRVLAEFWADGPDSETPPGHWFVILNEVLSNSEFQYEFEGQYEMEKLEYDVKAYFALGGAMHDAAIAAWGHKGWYDYIRPMSAIRALANIDLGDDSYPLVDDVSGIVTASDPVELTGLDGENVGQVKIKAFKGPRGVEFNDDGLPTSRVGAGWILANDWYPYQRLTFVTPPFAGYVSGHSTFSRAAAEVLTRLTGSAYFPGGIQQYEVEKDSLKFELGPSEDITLQWATYRDAADQSALSRIWGGIHPPVDDIPGRFLGEKVGVQAFEFAKQLFEYEEEVINEGSEEELCFPVKAKNGNVAVICL